MKMSPADVCCVPTCPNHSLLGQSDSFCFPFPTIPRLLHQWMRVILDPPNSKVCADHFASQDIILDVGLDGCGPRLKEGALPQFILRTGAYLMQTDTSAAPSSPDKRTKKSRGSRKRRSVAKRVAASKVVKRKDIAVSALPQVNEDIAGSASDNPTTTDSSRREVHEAEEPATDRVDTSATPSSAAKGTKKSRGSPKRPSVAKRVAASKVGKEIAVSALPQVNEDIAGSSSDNPITVDSSLREVHEAEWPATDRVDTSATPSSAAKGTKKSRGSPKRPSVAKRVTVSKVVKREEIAGSALRQVNEDIAGSSSDNPTTTDSSLRQVHEAEGPATDQVQGDQTASTSVSEVSKVNGGEETSADDLVCPDGDPSGLPWVCRICRQGFSVSVDLTRHVHKAHNVIVFPCEDCKKQFQTDEKLKFHMKFCGKGQGIVVPKSKQLNKADLYRAQSSRNVCIPSASTKTQQIGPGTKMVCKAAGGTHRADTTNISCSKDTDAMKSNSDNAPQRIIAVPMRKQLIKVDANHANTSRKDHIASTSTETQQVGQSAVEVHQAAAETSQVEPSDKTNVNYSKIIEAMKSFQKSDSVKTNLLTYRIVLKIPPSRPKKKIQVFQCEKCGKQLQSRTGVARHVQRSCPMVNDKYKCKTCGEAFTNKETLVKHCRAHHKKFKCETCGKQIFYKTNFMRHLKTHLKQKKRLKQKTFTAEETVICETCGKTFQNSTSLSLHRKAHSEKPYVCDRCGKKFLTDKILKAHCMIHMERICEYCGKICKSKAALRGHRKIHKTERPHVCDICSKSFLYRVHLVAHRRRHVGDKPYKCSMCNEAFYTKTAAEIHLTVHTGERPWKCETCGKQYRSRSHLNRHVRFHVMTLHHCGKCGKRFTTEEMLDLHEREHEKYEHVPAPFACSKCRKGFSEESSLKRHESYHHKTSRTHVSSERTKPVQRRKERKCKCVRCGKVLSCPYSLTLHERTHTGEKPFVCTTCCKAFNNPQTLKSHMRLHTGEKPYKCRVCGKAFRIAQSLARHETLHREKRDEAGQDLTSDMSAVDMFDSLMNASGPNVQ